MEFFIGSARDSHKRDSVGTHGLTYHKGSILEGISSGRKLLKRLISGSKKDASRVLVHEERASEGSDDRF